jgi:hypothetical protein
MKHRKVSPSLKRRSIVRTDTIMGIPSDDAVFMLPWYLPKQTYLAVRSMLPNIHINKMRYYFDDYGCIRCERRDVLYKTNGLCEACNAIVRFRLAHCLQKRLQRVGVVQPKDAVNRLDGGMQLAQKLLKPYRKGNKHKPRGRVSRLLVR